ncbi:sulfatase [Sesbania bispinosa]|nr:sulfatase [Sesbania bispinosa]
MGGLKFGCCSMQQTSFVAMCNGVNTNRNRTTNQQNEFGERTIWSHRWWSKEDGRMESTKNSSGSSKLG